MANLIMGARDQMLDLENVGGPWCPAPWSLLMRLLMNGFYSNITQCVIYTYIVQEFYIQRVLLVI